MSDVILYRRTGICLNFARDLEAALASQFGASAVVADGPTLVHLTGRHEVLLPPNVTSTQPSGAASMAGGSGCRYCTGLYILSLEVGLVNRGCAGRETVVTLWRRVAQLQVQEGGQTYPCSETAFPPGGSRREKQLHALRPILHCNIIPHYWPCLFFYRRSTCIKTGLQDCV